MEQRYKKRKRIYKESQERFVHVARVSENTQNNRGEVKKESKEENHTR